ncbi:cathepsin L-like [Euwallacea similis]|uniref:cathepsin L-like n=1 Tax=Euwallacea similis TaxID=1736056 RepID=UPI00344C5305
MFYKTILLLLSLLVIVMSAPTSKLLLEPVDVQLEWTNWKTQHKKNYENADEESNRFKIFQENVKKIVEHNKKFQAGEETWSQGLNQFADLTHEEFSKSYLRGVRLPPQPLANPQ